MRGESVRRDEIPDGTRGDGFNEQNMGFPGTVTVGIERVERGCQ